MSHFFRNGNTFRVADNNAVEVHDSLPAGNYIVKQDPFKNFYLEMVEEFQQISKLYGDTQRNADRIISTFLSRSVSTGVLLNGEKGSGKSLLAKTLCIDTNKLSIPTIIINQPWVGDDFNKLIQDINQPAVILFDEFEKTYDSDSQEQMLTLLDGVFPTKKLFVLTCNDKYRVDRHMRNRPGRIFYMLEFKGLGTEFIREYCNDNLKEDAKHFIPKICDIAMLFDQFNFDMLKALVEEMNRYNDSPQEALRMLNAKPEFGGDVKYDVLLTYKGRTIKTYKTWEGNPMTAENIRFDFSTKEKKNNDDDEVAIALDEDDDDYIVVRFSSNDIVSILPQDGIYTFKQDESELTLTRQKTKFFHWDAL